MTTRWGGVLRQLRTGAAGACLALPWIAGLVLAGTSGKISGRIVDEKQQPLAGVNVSVPTARLGAITDVDGRYVILNVPAGTYEVKLALLGYQPKAVQNVIVSADQTTRLDGGLTVAPVAIQEVVVTAERPIVDLNRTSTLAAIDKKQIAQLPVQELQDVVNLQAGVIDGHFRGGRKGEVQYQVDGVTVNNVYDNTSTLKLDRSLLEEVQVISGTFDAEYGQAMSGVVNAVLRRGTDKFRWDAEVMTGAFVFPGQSYSEVGAVSSVPRRIEDYTFHPGGIWNAQASLSGPLPLPQTTFLVSARGYKFDDWVYGTRTFNPTDRSDFENVVVHPTGDGEQVPLAYTREWSGVAKLSNRSIHSVELNYQAVFNHIEGRRAEYIWRLNPDGLNSQRTVSLSHGLELTHTLGPKTYYNINVRQNYFDYRDRLYDDLYDPRYDAASIPQGSPNYADGAYVQGASTTRFRQQTNALVAKGAWVWQYQRDQQFKTGAEYQWPTMTFGSMGYILPRIVNGVLEYVRVVDEPPTFPGATEFKPRLGAAYVQNDGEWNDLRVRAGARFEVFFPNATIPSDLKNPANALPPPAPQSVPLDATTKVSLAPRIGVSYPVTNEAALFFAYGHFYQMPALGTAYNDADYDVLATLQAGTNNFRVMGNPDIKPERTVQYQFGFRQAVTKALGLELDTFYKDIRDLLGVEFITTYNDAQYARLTNVDFGDVLGFTVSLDFRSQGLFSATLDYTWQNAQGDASEPNETAVRAEAGQDPRPREVPFTWDQRHTLNATAIWSRPGAFNASAIVRVASGQPYTPTVSSGFAGGLETNSGRKPAAMSVDLRGEKVVTSGKSSFTLFSRIFNLFDTRYFNGFVFGSTGSPYYSSDLSTDHAQLADPTRFYSARRIEIGVTMGGGAEAR